MRITVLSINDNSWHHHSFLIGVHWHTISYYFQVYAIVIQNLYALEIYPHYKSRYLLPKYHFLILRSPLNCRIISDLAILLVVENTLKIRYLKIFLQRPASNSCEMSFLYISPSKFIPFFLRQILYLSMFLQPLRFILYLFSKEFMSLLLQI